jgi:hypothetical protein
MYTKKAISKMATNRPTPAVVAIIMNSPELSVSLPFMITKQREENIYYETRKE